MISIRLPAYDDPATMVDTETRRKAGIWQRWRRACEARAKQLRDAVDGGSDPAAISVSTLYRHRPVKTMHFMAKDGPFRGKCAYCETFITDFQHGDIEHFRPKGAVTDKANAPVPVRDRAGTERTHWGYYWLAYSERNLLPSCQLCNQPVSGNLGKRTRFPITGTRARYHDDDLTAEQPLLLNPLEDFPEKHLDVDVETGVLIALSDRGAACIEIFGLNQRDQLVLARQAAAREVKSLWSEIGLPATKAKAMAHLQQILQGRGQCTAAARAMFLTLKKAADEAARALC